MPMSFFGDGDEFSRFSVSDAASFSGIAYPQLQYPNTTLPYVNIALTASLEKVVFNAEGTANTFAGGNLYSQPFFAPTIQPSDDSSIYTFTDASTGNTTILNYVQPNAVSQSQTMVNQPYSLNFACKDNPAPSITVVSGGATAFVSKSADIAYDSYNAPSPSNQVYKIKFTSAPSVISPGAIAIINYVDVYGVLQNYTLSSGSTVELDCQTSLHLQGGDQIIGSINLEQEILRPVNLQGAIPYKYHNQARQYRATTQFDAATLHATIQYMSGSNKNIQATSLAGETYEFYATQIPMIDNCAMVKIEDISNWDYISLASSSLSSSVRTESNLNTYYLNVGSTITIGNTIYTNYQKTNTVGSAFFKDPTDSVYYYQTNTSGLITDQEYCAGNVTNVTYDIESGSVMNASSQSLSPSTNWPLATLDVEQHFISGTFDGQKTLEVNTPSPTSGSAEITYTIPSLDSPTNAYSALLAFYSNGNEIWDTIPTKELNLLENPQVAYRRYGITVNNEEVLIYGGAGSPDVLPSGSWNNPGWNIFQYSFDASASRIYNYNINGLISGSFTHKGGNKDNIGVVKFNRTDFGNTPNSKLANGSHFQVLDVSLEARGTASMDTLFTEYNRYGL